MTDRDKAIGELAAVGRRLVSAGLVVATGGNLSARLRSGTALVSAAGAALDELAPTTFTDLTLDGHRRDGHPTPSSEHQVHLAAYAARPDVGAVIHAHPPMATLLHALGRQIRRFTTDHAYYVRAITLVGYHHPGGTEVAAATAAALADADVVLLAHHGCVTVAATPLLAFQRVVNLEAAAVATYRALLLGDQGSAVPTAFLEHLETRDDDGV